MTPICLHLPERQVVKKTQTIRIQCFNDRHQKKQETMKLQTQKHLSASIYKIIQRFNQESHGFEYHSSTWRL